MRAHIRSQGWEAWLLVLLIPAGLGGYYWELGIPITGAEYEAAIGPSKLLVYP